MKKIICILACGALLGACEQKTEVAAPENAAAPADNPAMTPPPEEATRDRAHAAKEEALKKMEAAKEDVAQKAEAVKEDAAKAVEDVNQKADEAKEKIEEAAAAAAGSETTPNP